MENSTLAKRVVIFMVTLICGVIAASLNGIQPVIYMVFLILILFPTPIFGEAIYDRLMRKTWRHQAIMKLTEVITEWSDSYYHPSSGVKTDPKFVELDLTLPSKRERTQKLLDSLIAERARKAMAAFNDKLLAENESSEMSRKLKRLDPRLVGSMTRKEIQTPLDDLKILEREAAAAKSEYHNLRKLVCDAGFKVWENIECYLALKIN